MITKDEVLELLTSTKKRKELYKFLPQKMPKLALFVFVPNGIITLA